MMEKIYWVGDGQVLVTTTNGEQVSISGGHEIKPEHMSDGKKAGVGLTQEFVDRHTALGNISTNPLAGKKVSGNKFLENKVVEQQRRIQELESLISGGQISAPAQAALEPATQKAAGKKAASDAIVEPGK